MTDISDLLFETKFKKESNFGRFLVVREVSLEIYPYGTTSRMSLLT